MQWKNGQEFVRPVYTPLSGPNVRLLEQADRVSNTTPEPGINGSPKIPHKSSVRMLIISTSCHEICTCYRFYLFAFISLQLYTSYSISSVYRCILYHTQYHVSQNVSSIFVMFNKVTRISIVFVLITYELYLYLICVLLHVRISCYKIDMVSIISFYFFYYINGLLRLIFFIIFS